MKVLLPLLVSLGTHILIVLVLSIVIPENHGSKVTSGGFKVAIVQEKNSKADQQKHSVNAGINRNKKTQSRKKTITERNQKLKTLGIVGKTKNDPGQITHYLHNLRKKIFDNLNYPTTARQKMQEGRVELKLKILEDGKISDLKIGKSSGFSILDNAAITAVKKCQNLSVPPLALNSKTLRIPIDFNLSD